MPFEKGQVANPSGNNGKPFRDALRMELAAAGADQKALRDIARNLIALATAPEATALPAINAVADRIDGKVAQPIGGSDELPPHKLEVSWQTEPAGS